MRSYFVSSSPFSTISATKSLLYSNPVLKCLTRRSERRSRSIRSPDVKNRRVGDFLHHLDVDGERYGADDFGIVPRSDVDDLFDRLVEDAVLVGADLDAKAMYGVGFFSAGERCNGSGSNGGCFLSARSAHLLYRRFCCHRTRRVCTIGPQNAISASRQIFRAEELSTATVFWKNQRGATRRRGREKIGRASC